MGCGTGIVKFVMFLFNFMFVVGGILMVTAGVLTLTGYQDYQHLVPQLDEYKAPPILLIAAGCAVFLIAFMGCCGVLRENNCMMMTYAVFLSIILLVQVGIAVAAYLYEDDFKEAINKGLEKSINNYNQQQVKDGWDTMQSNLKCCGYNEYKDWQIHGSVPESCCLKPGEGCSDGVLNEDAGSAKDKIYVQGCVDKMFSKLNHQYVIIAAAVIAGIEFIGIMFACCLAARFRRKNYV